MNNDGYYDYISKFTLALMVDSGWYRIDDISTYDIVKSDNLILTENSLDKLKSILN